MMRETLSLASWRDGGEPDECAFIVGPEPGGNPGGRCAQPRKEGSPYCARHHALCYLPSGGLAETRRLKVLEALALAVGGRCGGAGETPSPGFLVRVERFSRNFL
jgi:hypothetical protein